MNTLLTFESAARLRSLSQAAKELHTSQPAISRDIAKLEKQLSTRLFNRSRNGVSLTDTGHRYREAVTACIGILGDAALEVASQPDDEQVVLACSHEASHFYLMPRYEALQKALGEHVRIRVLTYHYHRQGLPPEPIADVVLSWEANSHDGAHVQVYEEAVRPLFGRNNQGQAPPLRRLAVAAATNDAQILVSRFGASPRDFMIFIARLR